MRTFGWIVALISVLVFGGVVSAPSAWAQKPELTAKQRADKEKREKRALADFSAGKYQEAIDIMAELYADFQEPLYYRNIGRCYQKLGDPDRAIAAFEEFLSKAKDAPPAQVAETKDLIRQMQELKQKKAGDQHQAAPPPPPPPPPDPTPIKTTPGPTTTTGPTSRDPGPVGNIVEPPPPPKASGGGHRTLGWVLLGGGAVLLAAGGGVLYSSIAEYNKSKDTDKCPNPAIADMCRMSSDTVKSRNLTSQILFAAGGVAAAIGGIVLLVSPSPSSEVSSDGFNIALRGRF
jgi:tetratricopeptide (TPR) repeat protein